MADPQNPRIDTLSVWLERFLEWLEARNYSPRTIETRRVNLQNFIHWCGERSLHHPNEITLPILERYQRYLFYYRKPNGEPLTFRTQATRLVPIKAFFKWLTRSHVILYNPASELELPRGEKRLPKAVMTVEEVEAVLMQADTSTAVGLRDRAIMEMFYATAIRRLELIELGVFDVDYGRNTLFIRQGKGKRDRMVPIGERARAWLDRYRDEARPELSTARDEGRLFLSTHGGPLTPKRLSGRVQHYVRKAGIGKAGSCHMFRHTAATLMLENGADIRFIQALLGHASLETTQVYTQVGINKLSDIHAATHPGARLARRELDLMLEIEAGEETL